MAWPRGRSSHPLGEREESWVWVKEIRSRVRLRKEERKRASSEITRNEGEAEEVAEEGPKAGAKREEDQAVPWWGSGTRSLSEGQKCKRGGIVHLSTKC